MNNLSKEITKYLKSINCIFVDEPVGYKDCYSTKILTSNGDYVGLADLTTVEGVIDLIYKHKLTNLMSIDFAKNGIAENSVGIGFNEEEQKWYGWTHRGFGSFGIGWKPKEDSWAVTHDYISKDFECKTLEDCKFMAICMSDYLD